jgi:hypothetical protein
VHLIDEIAGKKDDAMESGASGERQEEKKDETKEERLKRKEEAVKFVGKSCSIS